MRTRVLESEGEHVALIICLQVDRVVVARTLEHFLEAREVDAERAGAIAAVVLEAVVTQHHRHQTHVRGVHRLIPQLGSGSNGGCKIHQTLPTAAPLREL